MWIGALVVRSGTVGAGCMRWGTDVMGGEPAGWVREPERGHLERWNSRCDGKEKEKGRTGKRDARGRAGRLG